MHTSHLFQTHPALSVTAEVVTAWFVENPAVTTPMERGAVAVGNVSFKTGIRIQMPIALVTRDLFTLYAFAPVTSAGSANILT